MEDFAKSEAQQILWDQVPHSQKVPLQGFFSVPAESVSADYLCDVWVKTKTALLFLRDPKGIQCGAVVFPDEGDVSSETTYRMTADWEWAHGKA